MPASASLPAGTSTSNFNFIAPRYGGYRNNLDKLTDISSSNSRIMLSSSPLSALSCVAPPVPRNARHFRTRLGTNPCICSACLQTRDRHLGLCSIARCRAPAIAACHCALPSVIRRASSALLVHETSEVACRHLDIPISSSSVRAIQGIPCPTLSDERHRAHRQRS